MILYGLLAISIIWFVIMWYVLDWEDVFMIIYGLLLTILLFIGFADGDPLYVAAVGLVCIALHCFRDL